MDGCGFILVTSGDCVLGKVSRGDEAMSGPRSKQRPRQTAIGRVVAKSVRETKARNAESRLRRIDTDILTVQGVAELVFCSVQSARNIPEDELPRHPGPGRRNLFIKEDVIQYVRRVRRTNPAADEMVPDIENDRVESSSDSGRRHRRRSNSDDQNQ